MIKTREELFYLLKELEELTPLPMMISGIMQNEYKVSMDELEEWVQTFERFREDLNAEHQRQNELASKAFIEVYKYVEYLNEEGGDIK